MSHRFDTMIRDIEVEITFTTTGYDNTDVGGGVNDLDEWEISTVYDDNETPESLHEKLTPQEEELIVEKCYDHLQ